MTQATLFAGLDCLHGQADLFETDGEPEAKGRSSGSPSIQHRPDGFWAFIDGLEPMGPYPKLSEAQEDLEGVERCLANIDNHSFWTVLK